MVNPSYLVSVVAILDNDANHLDSFVTETIQHVEEHNLDYELVLVDDGSTDHTPEVTDRILSQHECVRVIRLSRRFGADIAVTAGLDSSIGDYAVVMVAASDPPAKIPEMVALARQGVDLVIGTSSPDHESFLKRRARRAFFGLFRRLVPFHLPENAASMRLFSRQTLNALTRIRQKTVHARLLGCSIGFRTTTLEYRPIARGTAQRSRPWSSILGEAMSLLVTNSPAPLRLVSYLGVSAALLNVLYMIYVVSVHCWKSQVAEGWTTLSLQMSFMFLLFFSTLVVFSEYLVHTFEEVKDRPLYHVADEKNSSTAKTDAEKRNVCSQFQDDQSPSRSSHDPAA